jgi:hypothetical protein
MKNILHITNTDPARDSRIQKELVALTKLHGVKVFSIGVPERKVQADNVLDGSILMYIGLLVRRLQFIPRPIRYFFELIEFTVRAVIYGRRIKPDVIHSHDTFALPAGWILKLLSNGRLVYDAHELESDKNGQNLVLSKATLFIERFCWGKVDLLISVSESILSWYAQKFGEVPCLLVLNAPVVQQLSEPREIIDIASKYFHGYYGIPADHLVFLYLGILGQGRGIELCLEAFAGGPDNVHVVFVGFGEMESQIAAKAERFSNIHIHPPVAHDQVVPLATHADYGLCLVENASLSDYYCLPNKLFEYCFARIPVLASNLPEINRLVNKFALGVCCEPNVVSVRSALKKIVEGSDEYNTADVSSLSWETQESRLKKYYEEILLV